MQDRLARELQLAPLPSHPRLIAGTDVSYVRRLSKAFAAVVVLDAADLSPVEVRTAVRPIDFPYVPGLLAFREIPALLDCFSALSSTPEVTICDGQGLAHPRHFGLACHLGVLLDLPAVGCAKTKLVGEFREPGLEEGARQHLFFRGEIVGAVIRTRTRVKPVFVSPGHRADVASSADLVLRVCAGRRLPEPTRRAHLEVEKLKRSALEEES